MQRIQKTLVCKMLNLCFVPNCVAAITPGIVIVPNCYLILLCGGQMCEQKIQESEQIGLGQCSSQPHPSLSLPLPVLSWPGDREWWSERGTRTWDLGGDLRRPKHQASWRWVRLCSSETNSMTLSRNIAHTHTCFHTHTYSYTEEGNSTEYG